MNSTPTPKAIEPRDGLITRADEGLAHATNRSGARMNSSRMCLNSLQKWSAMMRAHLRPDLARNHLLKGWRLALARNHRQEGRRSGSSSACRWRRASLSLPWFYSRPMAGGPSWLSRVGRRSSFQLHHCRRKIRRFPRSPRHLPFKWPRRRQHRRKQRPWLRPHRKMPRRQQPQRFPITHSCCKRWRAISRMWSETSNSSGQTSNK